MSRKISKIRNWPFKSNPSLNVDVKKKKNRKRGLRRTNRKRERTVRSGDMAI